jgi:hypothetical protein
VFWEKEENAVPLKNFTLEGGFIGYEWFENAGKLSGFLGACNWWGNGTVGTLGTIT